MSSSLERSAARHALVVRSMQGDAAAFDALVRDSRRWVAAAAYGWLGDIEAAREVAQEVFLTAHRHLHELREPQAFVGWMKRIVVRHCDRVTRRRELPRVALDVAAHVADDGVEPDGAYLMREQHDQVRLAVSALSPPLRACLALRAFAEMSQREIADFLELPLTTVKKRLHDANVQLRAEGVNLMQESKTRQKATIAPELDIDVRFFIALRQGDRATVRAMLDAHPRLVNAVQDWSPELAHNGVLPFANRATALITSVEQDDLPMLRLLLDHGADVDGRCGCATAESPLWAAALFGRVAHTAELLRRGADPNVSSAGGTTPLIVAAMRGEIDIVDALLRHGADPALRQGRREGVVPFAAADGSAHRLQRTPVEWARANGHGAVAARIARQGGDVMRPSAAMPPLAASPWIRTGIRALDLFAPIKRGGLVHVPFRAGVGMLVLLGELTRRVTRDPSGTVVWSGFAQRPYDVKDLETELDEFGFRDDVQVHLASFECDNELRREAFARGVAAASAARDAGRHVLLVLQSESGFEADLESSYPTLSAPHPAGSITTLVIGTQHDALSSRDGGSLAPPWTGRIVLDRVRARRSLYPAIDPELSSSTVDVGTVGVEHVQVATAVRALLADYRRRDPSFDGLTRNDNGSTEHRVLRYLAQPFFTTEPFTGIQGQTTAQAELLARLTGLMAA